MAADDPNPELAPTEAPWKRWAALGLCVGTSIAMGIMGLTWVFQLDSTLGQAVVVSFAVLVLLAGLRLTLLGPEQRNRWFGTRKHELTSSIAAFLRHIAELPSFTYTEVVPAEPGRKAETLTTPYRSFIQWLIMGIGEVIALTTAVLVTAVFLTLAFPVNRQVMAQHAAHAGASHHGTPSEQPSAARRMLGVYDCPDCSRQVAWFHAVAARLTFIYEEEGEHGAGPASPGETAGSSSNAPIDPKSREWTLLGLAMLQLANIGILVLSANAVLEIGLLIEEPGVEHVRRVLALSFTGMALYLIKEYPIRHSKEEFELGCVAGGIAAILWIMHPLQELMVGRVRAMHGEGAKPAPVPEHH